MHFRSYFFGFAVSCLALSSAAFSKKITFSVHDFAPYVLIEDKTPKGAFVDIVSEVCKLQKLECEVLFFPNRRSKKVLKNGKVNGNFPLGWNAKRDEWILWTPPLMAAEYSFFKNTKTSFNPTKLSDMSGKSVGVFGPSNTSRNLEKLSEQLKKEGKKPIKIKMIPNSTGQNMLKLSTAKIDGVFINKSVGLHQINTQSIKNVDYAFTTKRLRYYGGFAKEHNDPKMVAQFNEGVKKLDDSGKLAEIVKKYNLDPIDKSLEIK